jgi:PAS domain S-box-containing protein
VGNHPSPGWNGAADRGRSLFDSLGEACLALDAGRRVLYCNPACAALLGAPAAALLGRPLADDCDLFPSDLHRRALAGERVRYGPAHAGRHFAAVLEPLRDPAGRVAGVVGLAHDVTELHRATEEQRRLREQAWQAQRLESLGLLAGGLAHDFNNLLVGVLTAADLLRRDLPPGSGEHELAQIITRAAERAAGLSRQLLLYAGKGQPARRPLALNAAVEEGLALLAAAMPKSVTLVTALAPGLPPADADPGQLRQVITNLVHNAAEAVGTNPGRVRLATGVEEKDEGGRMKEEGAVPPSSFLLPPSALAGRYVYLEVSDDGCGVAADVLARICDPFFTTKGKGRSLGLSAVQGIVRGHGGGLRVVSVPGAGTTVRVLLPAADGMASV